MASTETVTWVWKAGNTCRNVQETDSKIKSHFMPEKEIYENEKWTELAHQFWNQLS
jgi:hypothetical protein